MKLDDSCCYISGKFHLLENQAYFIPGKMRISLWIRVEYRLKQVSLAATLYNVIYEMLLFRQGHRKS
jgi:hypothetical protein